MFAWPMAATLLFAPAVFPWYLLWLLPFLTSALTLLIIIWTEALSRYTSNGTCAHLGVLGERFPVGSCCWNTDAWQSLVQLLRFAALHDLRSCP